MPGLRRAAVAEHDRTEKASLPPEVRILQLNGNKIADLQPLVEEAQADAKGERRFAPYLRLSLAGNPLSAEATSMQVSTLKEAGVRLMD
jgi:internalin A